MNKIFLFLACAAVSIFHQQAFSADAGARVLEEVLVTAQRRSQSIQDVPISMSVVSAEDLQRNAIFDFTETAQLTPGVELNTESATLASINVRGVGPTFASAAAQSVPIFVDQVAAASAGAVFSTIVDVARIELLRGPQGTLYGTNAPSGAYNITTVAPTFDGVAGYVNGSYSQWESNDEDTTDIRGAVNVPLGDSVAVRIAGVYADSDGFVSMEGPDAVQDNTGGKEHKSARARLMWDISEVSELNITANYQDVEDTWSLRSWDGRVAATGGDNATPAIYSSFDDREDFGILPSSSSTDVNDVSLRYSHEAQWINIDVIVGYQNYETSLFQNQNPYPRPDPGSFELTNTVEQATMELRVSDAGELIDYVGGIYLTYSDVDAATDLITRVQISDMVEAETTGAAVFANFAFHLAQQWDFSAGMRYEDNTEEYRSEAFVSGTVGSIDEDLDFSHLSWSLKLNYLANENATGYLAIDNAYRKGGLNTYVPAIAQLGQALGSDLAVEAAESSLIFDEEVSTAFEIGVKGTAMEDRLRYNVAVFYQIFDDHIIRQEAPSGSEFNQIRGLFRLVNTNAEEVVTQGVELDALYLINDNWSVDFRAAYAEATIEEWGGRFCTTRTNDPDGLFCPSDSGDDLTDIPQLNATTQLIYNTPMGDGWELDSTLTWAWRDSSDGEPFIADYKESKSLLNLNLSFSRDAYAVSLWGKNLTDEHTTQIPTPIPDQDPNLDDTISGKHNPGREYGITLGYNF